MKRIEYDQYGGPERMRLADFELPLPGPGEVAVAVKFAAINPIDWKMRNGAMKIVTGRSFPRAMGMDLSGTVISVGAGVTRFRPGDAVFGLARFKQAGALAEAAIANETALALKPDNISFEQAACLGAPGVTAWNGLADKAAVKAGQSVFINGCNGSVGRAAVQIAQLFGAKVSGSCGAEAMDQARAQGVGPVYDYRKTDFSKIGRRFDVVYDTSGTMKTALGLSMIHKDGVFLDLEPSAGKFVRALFNRKLKLVICTPRSEILDGVAGAARDGKFQLPIGEIVPLSEAIQLIAALENGHRLSGRAVVRMD